MKQLSIVVPFFNARDHLPVLYDRTVRVLEGQPETQEMLVSDDGSSLPEQP